MSINFSLIIDYYYIIGHVTLKNDNESLLFLQTKQNALTCIARLLDSLDRMIVLEEILPFLTDINSHDVDIIMIVLGMYVVSSSIL